MNQFYEKIILQNILKIFNFIKKFSSNLKVYWKIKEIFVKFGRNKIHC